jgi:uncharacterized protein YdeI (BOF family)
MSAHPCRRLADRAAAMAVLLAMAGPLAADTHPAVIAAEDVRRNMNVTVEGVVDRVIEDDEFFLRDLTGMVRVHVGPNPMPVAEGDRIIVIGHVDGDLQVEIDASEIRREDGQLIRLAQD